jgi:hypothetical protein
LSESEIRHGALRAGGAFDGAVVVEDQLPVGGEADVEFESVGALHDRLPERGE